MSNQHLKSTADVWIPPEPTRCADWVPAHIRVPAELETPGAFDLDKFPHARGVLEAADDTGIREIYLRWATRNAKTFTALSVLVCLVDQYQRPGLFAAPDEASADDIVQTSVYPMLEACEATRSRLLPDHRRNEKYVVIGRSRIRKSYAGSKTRLARFPACYGLATEVGLWPINMINRFRQRGRLFPFDRKMIFEGKPEEEGNCAISALVDSPTTQRRHYQVPCPHCNTFQRLTWGDQKSDTPGIKWDSTKGKRDPLTASKTAFYQCQNGCRIDDVHRGEMMRAGVWVAEGQHVDDEGQVCGTPDVDGQNVAFDELSSLYALVISGWGQLVREYFEAKDDIETYREFVTGTLAQCWKTQRADIAPNVVAERFKTDEPLRRVPEWGKFLTRSFDVQNQAGGLEFPWGVCAWGDDGRGTLIDYGVAYGWHELKRLHSEQQYSHADGGTALQPCWTCIDCSDGNVSEEVYAMAGQLARTLPIKGMAHKMQPAYRFGELGGGRSKSRYSQRQRVLSGQTLLLGANSDRSQDWLQKHIEGVVKRGSPQWFSLPLEASMDEFLLSEILNEFPEDGFDPRGFKKRTWNRKDPNKPNDMRDVIRYCWVLAMFVTDQGKNWNALPDRDRVSRAAPKVQKSQPPALLTGGGRSWR